MKLKYVIFLISFLLLAFIFVRISSFFATNLFNGIILVLLSIALAFGFVKEFYDIFNGN